MSPRHHHPEAHFPTASVRIGLTTCSHRPIIRISSPPRLYPVVNITGQGGGGEEADPEPRSPSAHHMRASAHQVEEETPKTPCPHSHTLWRRRRGAERPSACKCQQRRDPQDTPDLEEAVNRPEHRDVVAITPGTTCRRVRSAHDTAHHLPLSKQRMRAARGLLRRSPNAHGIVPIRCKWRASNRFRQEV